MGEAAKVLLDKKREEEASLRLVNGRLVPNPYKRPPTPLPVTGKRG
jgi:hypothetical protein